MNSSQLAIMQMVILRSLHKEIADKISPVLPHGSAQCPWAQAAAVLDCVRLQVRFSVAQPKRGREQWKR
jgi:hypothetical protein